MNKILRNARAMALCLALPALAGTPVGAAQPDAEFAKLSPEGAAVVWEIQSNAPEAVLSVSGPDVAIRQTSLGGSSLDLALIRADGSLLPDGTYAWEIRESYPGMNDSVYDPYNGRNSVEKASASTPIDIRGRVQSGVFTIKNGSVVDSTVVEEDASEGATAAGKEAQ